MRGIIKIFVVIISALTVLICSDISVFAMDGGTSDDEIRTEIDSMLEEYDMFYSYDDMDELSIGSIINTIKDSLSARLNAPFRLLGIILVTIMFSSLVKTTGEAFFRDIKSADICNIVCVAASGAIICSPLFEVYDGAVKTLQTGGNFMLAFVPIYVALVITSGGIISAGVYNMVILAAAELMVQLANAVVMPLLAMMTGLAVTGSVFPDKKTESILSLLKKILTWGMTIATTLFSGFVSLKSTLGASVDGFASKSVKFVISGFIPVIGSAVSDAYSTVRGSFSIMRCTAGTAGTVAVLLIFLPPLAELLTFRLVLWIGTATAGMFSSDSMERLLKGLDYGLSIAMSVMVCFGVLFVICTAILMKSGA